MRERALLFCHGNYGKFQNIRDQNIKVITLLHTWTLVSCLKSRWKLWLGELLHNFMLGGSCALSWIMNLCTQLFSPGHLISNKRIAMCCTWKYLKSIWKLQLAQNPAAQIAFGVPRVAQLHVSHWLTVSF